MSFIRVTLLPVTPKLSAMTVDVPDTALVLSNGSFQPVQTAKTLTLTGVSVEQAFKPFNDLQQAISITNQQTQELKIIYREPVDTQTNLDTSVVEQTDPTNGVGVYGITLNETRITFAKVTAVTEVSAVAELV